MKKDTSNDPATKGDLTDMQQTIAEMLLTSERNTNKKIEAMDRRTDEIAKRTEEIAKRTDVIIQELKDDRLENRRFFKELLAIKKKK